MRHYTDIGFALSYLGFALSYLGFALCTYALYLHTWVASVFMCPQLSIRTMYILHRVYWFELWVCVYVYSPNCKHCAHTYYVYWLELHLVSLSVRIHTQLSVRSSLYALCIWNWAEYLHTHSAVSVRTLHIRNLFIDSTVVSMLVNTQLRVCTRYI